MPKFFEPATPPKLEPRVESQNTLPSEAESSKSTQTDSVISPAPSEARVSEEVRRVEGSSQQNSNLTDSSSQDSQNDNNNNEEQHYFSPKISESGEVKTLLEWTAPSRPFRPKDRSYYTTIAILVILLCLIALLAREILLIGVLLALAFVAYVLAYVPPTDIKYKISTQGITIGDHFYFWHDCDSFWFKEKDGHQVLFIQTYFMFPAQLMLVLKDIDQEEVKKVVARFLPFHEIPRTSFIDRWGEKLQKHFPLENTHN